MARLLVKDTGEQLLDQSWYERAADTIASSYTRPAERLAMLNELWGEYLLAVNMSAARIAMSITGEQWEQMLDKALQEKTGLSLQQIINHAKEMLKNGQNETQAAATGTE